MKFIPLENLCQVDEIREAEGYNVIFKHNTTCSISKSVRKQFEQEADSIAKLNAVYFLDLLAHRDISDNIAEQFSVQHESPQLLLISRGKCMYNESLYDISAKKTAGAIS
ncbi:MAG: bacillithiol system redox-active protein YtxJ [Chitinophagaceae bacterium]